MRTSKTIGRTRKQTERLIGHAHHVGLATIPPSLLRIGPSAPPGLTVTMELCPRYWQSEPFYRMVDIGKTSWSKTSTSLTVSKFEKYFRVMKIQGTETFRHGFHDIQNADLCAQKPSVKSWPPLAVQWLCSNVFCCIRVQASSVDRVAVLVAEWFSLHERLIIQPVSEHFSSAQRETQARSAVKHRSPKKLRASCSLQNKPTGPATSPYSHHVATERVEELSPFGSAASSNGALPTPSRLSEHVPHSLETRHKRSEHCRQRTQHQRSHIGIMSCYADGGRVLELLFHYYITVCFTDIKTQRLPSSAASVARRRGQRVLQHSQMTTMSHGKLRPFFWIVVF